MLIKHRQDVALQDRQPDPAKLMGHTHVLYFTVALEDEAPNI